jgi:hypothetical protein
LAFNFTGKRGLTAALSTQLSVGKPLCGLTVPIYHMTKPLINMMYQPGILEPK